MDNKVKQDEVNTIEKAELSEKKTQEIHKRKLENREAFQKEKIRNILDCISLSGGTPMTMDQLRELVGEDFDLEGSSFKEIYKRVQEQEFFSKPAAQDLKDLENELKLESNIDTMNTIKAMKKEEKITMVVQRKRDVTGTSLHNKRQMMQDGKPVIRNGMPVLEDYITVRINGIPFNISLGEDLNESGPNDIVVVNDVPLNVAKILADSMGVVLKDPKTGKVIYQNIRTKATPQQPLNSHGNIVQSQELQNTYGFMTLNQYR